jgi:hypothetical protein
MPSVWIAPTVKPLDVRYIHKCLHGYPNIIFPENLVRRPDMVIAPHFAVISGNIPDKQVFTITPTCFAHMMARHIDPLAFRSPNGSTSLINPTLLGKRVSLRGLDESATLSLARLIHLMGGFIELHDNVDYIISPTFLRPSNPDAMVVHPHWILEICKEDTLRCEPRDEEILYSHERELRRQLESERTMRSISKGSCPPSPKPMTLESPTSRKQSERDRRTAPSQTGCTAP